MSYSRQVRRAAARKAAKEETRQAKRGETPHIAIPPSAFEGLPAVEDISMADIDRYLDQQEGIRTGPTGPRTEKGKAKSSMNNLRHGLTGKFLVLDYESESEFETLAQALRDEHQPTTPTEQILVQRMAEHVWLSRRAQSLQDAALIGSSPHNLALFMRYQTTNDRAFHKCLADLSAMRRDQRRQAAEFESQKRSTELHALRVRLATTQITRREHPPAKKKTSSAPITNTPKAAPQLEKQDQAAA